MLSPQHPFGGDAQQSSEKKGCILPPCRDAVLSPTGILLGRCSRRGGMQGNPHKNKGRLRHEIPASEVLDAGGILDAGGGVNNFRAPKKAAR
jgi:hypothetical protein